MSRNRMVIRIEGEDLLKGYSHDFFPNHPVFHLQLVAPTGEPGETRKLRLDEVEAIFFVRDFAFDRTDHFAETPGEEVARQAPAGGRTVRVRFRWGEELEGLTYGYDAKRPGFFLYPTAPLHHAFNLERAYISRGGVDEVSFQ